MWATAGGNLTILPVATFVFLRLANSFGASTPLVHVTPPMNICKTETAQLQISVLRESLSPLACSGEQ
jgi:hypothetical protein